MKRKWLVYSRFGKDCVKVDLFVPPAWNPLGVLGYKVSSTIVHLFPSDFWPEP